MLNVECEIKLARVDLSHWNIGIFVLTSHPLPDEGQIIKNELFFVFLFFLFSNNHHRIVRVCGDAGNSKYL